MLYYLYLATLIQSLAAAKHLHHALADWSLKSAGPLLVILSTNFGDQGCSQFAGRAQQVGSYRHLMYFSSRQRRLSRYQTGNRGIPVLFFQTLTGGIPGKQANGFQSRFGSSAFWGQSGLSKSTLTHTSVKAAADWDHEEERKKKEERKKPSNRQTSKKQGSTAGQSSGTSTPGARLFHH